MLTTIVPQSPVLRNYIECFYVFNSDVPSRLSYLAFPHYHTGLSFFKGATITREDFQIVIEESANRDVQVEVLGKYINPVRIEYSGKIQEVSIIFKPLGLNRFLRENYYSIAADFSQRFENIEWERFGEKLFGGDDQVNRLEEFLLSKFCEVAEVSKIETALPMLHSADANYSLAEITDSVGYKLKTFQRHFLKHMGCTPVDYKRIARFRNAIVSKLNAKEIKSLTDISYENNYFDQSYFIKEFRKLTGHNPARFFKVLQVLDNEKIIWEIL